MSQRYQSRPQVVEALRWIGDNIDEILDFVGNNQIQYFYEDGEWTGQIKLLAGKFGAQGYVEFPIGHWVVCSVGDYTDFWPVEADYFAKKYEPA